MSPAATIARDKDLETRDRLLNAGATLFSKHGFAEVTVRDICRAARANVAAVNYHFDGKAGLYEQVMRKAIAVMQQTTMEAIREGEGRSPGEQLTAYISVFLRRVSEGRDGWIHQMMMRELSQPTPALDLVVNEVIEPRMRYLSQVVSAIMKVPVRDPRVGLCVMSVHSQCLATLGNQVSERVRLLRTGSANVDQIASHIARFSLAGVRAITST